MSLTRSQNATTSPNSTIAAEKIRVLTEMFEELLDAQHCILASNKIKLLFLTIDEVTIEIRDVLTGQRPTYSGTYAEQANKYNLELTDLALMPVSEMQRLRYRNERRNSDPDFTSEANDRRELIEILIEKYDRRCEDAEKFYNSRTPEWPAVVPLTDYLQSIAQDMEREMFQLGQSDKIAEHVALETLADNHVTLPDELVKAIFTREYMQSLKREQFAIWNPRSRETSVVFPFVSSVEHPGLLTYHADSSQTLPYVLYAFIVAGVVGLSCLASRALGVDSFILKNMKNAFGFFRSEPRSETDLLPPDQELLIKVKKYTPTNDEFQKSELEQKQRLSPR